MSDEANQPVRQRQGNLSRMACAGRPRGRAAVCPKWMAMVSS